MSSLAMTQEPAMAMQKVTWNPSGITIDANVTFEEWQSIGETLTQLEKGIQWAIGDWLNYGESRWGDKYTQAVLELPYEAGSLRNMSYVAKRFDASLRSDKLSFSHYKTVAALEPAQADDYLARAENEMMSVQDLRELVHNKGSKIKMSDRIKSLENIARFVSRLESTPTGLQKLITDYEETFGWIS